MPDTNNRILTNARLFDGRRRADGEPAYREGAAVWIREGRIEKITDADTLPRTADYRVTDLGGMTLLPGLIDSHVHLPGAVGDEFQTLLINEKVRTIQSVAHAQQLLKWGFTSVRDISRNGLYLKRVFHKRVLAGPRIVACGPGLSRRGGHSDLPELPAEWVEPNHFWGILADGPEEIRRAVRGLFREGADQIKIWASGGGNNPVDKIAEQHYDLGELTAAVREAKMYRGTLVCAHAEERESIKDCLRAGVDTIEHGEDLDEEAAAMMRRQGTILVPTINLIANWYRDFMDPQAVMPPAFEFGPFFQRDIGEEPEPEAERARAIENFRFAREAGVPIAMGSDTVDEQVTPYGEYSAREMVCMGEFGMPPAEVLTAATGTAARALGLEGQIGTIETGKRADLLVMEGDPLERMELLLDQSNRKMIFCDGILTVEEGRLTY